MKIIKLTESDLTRIVKRVINENMNDVPRVLSEKQWEDIWFGLRKIANNKTFGVPEHNIFPFGGLFFNLNENGYLELPPQKLSDWRDDVDKAATILDNYVDRLKSYLYESGMNLKLYVDSDYGMRIYLY
jgi:hypothetical protein